MFDGRDREGRQIQGVKKGSTAYVEIDAVLFLDNFKHDGEPVTMQRNANGIILTKGARGPQDDRSDLRWGCIPPACIKNIKSMKTGHPVATIHIGNMFFKGIACRAKVVYKNDRSFQVSKCMVIE